MSRFTFPLLSLLLTFHSAHAELKVAGVFGDHAVLQQGVKVPIWGTASAGSQIEVRYREQVQRGVANGEGKWTVWLEPMKPGESAELKVSGDGEASFRDIVVGEVWFASGQSNMEMPFNNCENATAERALVNEPGIRIMKVGRKTTNEPAADNGGKWYPMMPNTVGGMSGAAYYFAREIHHSTGGPVGIIQSAWGGSPVEAWMPKEAMEEQGDPVLEQLHEQYRLKEERYPAQVEAHREALRQWEVDKAAREEAGEQFTTPPPEAPYGPGSARWKSSLFNGMVHPVIPYAIRGTIWYQGEANSASHALYADLFTRMIREWRRLWGQGDFPFLFVQLPNWIQGGGNPDMLWAHTREAQAKALTEPATGMIVTIDIGDPHDVHPKNKKEVGRRLSLLARSQVYGEKFAAECPTVAECRFSGSEATLRFRDAEALKWMNERTDGFEIAGKDGRFVSADAILSGAVVKVSAPGVSEPVMVRYAWANNPEAVLINEHGLPAAPYRSVEHTQRK